jgi:hypothetical protein
VNVGLKPRPDSSNREVLAGLIERVTFHNAVNGFCDVRIKARGHCELVTVVGTPRATCSTARVCRPRSMTLGALSRTVLTKPGFAANTERRAPFGAALNEAGEQARYWCLIA